MTKFLQNKAVRILGLIFLIVFLPFIPISFLIYRVHNKFSGLTKILIIAPLVIVFLLSFIWSWTIISPFKSQEPPLKVENSKTKLNQTPTSTPSLEKTLYKVTKVIDGDTIEVNINGRKEILRLIGIDTPETVDPRKPVQCFGKEASDKARAILSAKNVTLEADPTQGERDKYNRLLRYIFLEDGTSFNKYMISEGYANEYTYQSNPYKYQTEYKQAERGARGKKRGLWADDACPAPSTTTPTNPTIQPQPSIQPPSNTGGYTCNCSKTCTQISSCDEAYFQLNQCGCSARDRDGDGVPCETLCQ